MGLICSVVDVSPPPSIPPTGLSTTLWRPNVPVCAGEFVTVGQGGGKGKLFQAVQDGVAGAEINSDPGAGMTWTDNLSGALGVYSDGGAGYTFASGSQFKINGNTVSVSGTMTAAQVKQAIDELGISGLEVRLAMLGDGHFGLLLIGDVITGTSITLADTVTDTLFDTPVPVPISGAPAGTPASVFIFDETAGTATPLISGFPGGAAFPVTLASGVSWSTLASAVTGGTATFSVDGALTTVTVTGSGALCSIDLTSPGQSPSALGVLGLAPGVQSPSPAAQSFQWLRIGSFAAITPDDTLSFVLRSRTNGATLSDVLAYYLDVDGNPTGESELVGVWNAGSFSPAPRFAGSTASDVGAGLAWQVVRDRPWPRPFVTLRIRGYNHNVGDDSFELSWQVNTAGSGSTAGSVEILSQSIPQTTADPLVVTVRAVGDVSPPPLIVTIRLPTGPAAFLVMDENGFTPEYANSTSTANEDGSVTLSIVRAGGWPVAPISPAVSILVPA